MRGTFMCPSLSFNHKACYTLLFFPSYLFLFFSLEREEGREGGREEGGAGSGWLTARPVRNAYREEGGAVEAFIRNKKTT